MSKLSIYNNYLELGKKQEELAGRIKVAKENEKVQLFREMDYLLAEQTKMKHMLYRSNAGELIDTLIELEIEQLDLSNKLANENNTIIRSIYERQLDSMLLDMTEIHHKLERI